MTSRKKGFLIGGLAGWFTLMGYLVFAAWTHPLTSPPGPTDVVPAHSFMTPPVDHGVSTSTLNTLDTSPPVAATNTTPANLPSASHRPQFVTLAFDGSYSLDMWRKTRAFAQEMTMAGSPVHFTYFASGVYLLPYVSRNLYHPPQHPPGTSAISFAVSDKEVADRMEQMNLALAEGNEIESHANGHFDGGKWSLADWNQELNEFDHLVAAAAATATLRGEPESRNSIHFPGGKVIGFRAPELGRDAAMYDALAQHGFRYDTSGVGKPEAWPVKDAHGIWLFPLAKIRYANTSGSILSMDYNFYFKQTNAKDTLKQGTPEWQQAHDDMLVSFENYFNANYQGNRAPVTMGNHFSEWNDSLYWEVMKDFAREVCAKPEVRCVTFGELADWLDGQGTNTP